MAEGALEALRLTCAEAVGLLLRVASGVLAGGVDRAYPAGNARLLDAVVGAGGALVSEVPPGSLPTKSRFLQRNRLIAAAGRATVSARPE